LEKRSRLTGEHRAEVMNAARVILPTGIARFYVQGKPGSRREQWLHQAAKATSHDRDLTNR
jgi:hypothetical protein